MSDIEEAARQQKKMSQTTAGTQKWLGKVFEISRQPANKLFKEGETTIPAEQEGKKLLFAGINN